EQGVRAGRPDVVINGADAPRLWTTSSLGFPRLAAEGLLLLLSERGVFASAGAACASGSLEPSPVLLAMGIPEPVAHGSVRFSISRTTTRAEIDEAIPLVVEVANILAQQLPGA
ncbi:MAG: aminotransferase class V-fold PLP-dependent enzyme, partial [Planctomycetota bacterium]|nr:aminotransferase class V-fold PLP-dependent enzyme [Planctomycetota bacterium]